MVRREYDLDPHQSLYEKPDRIKNSDYEISEETDVRADKVYIDKSQHITQYTYNIHMTGQKLPDINCSSGLANPTFIVETELVCKLFTVLNEIGEVLGDVGAFEQKLSSFLSLLDEFEERKGQREIYFSDLLGILKMALVKIECNELTEKGISALREAVSCLGQKVTEQKLKELRGRFRNGGIDLLKPFKSQVDVKSILKEIYPDEITT